MRLGADIGLRCDLERHDALEVIDTGEEQDPHIRPHGEREVEAHAAAEWPAGWFPDMLDSVVASPYVTQDHVK